MLISQWISTPELDSLAGISHTSYSLITLGATPLSQVRCTCAAGTKDVAASPEKPKLSDIASLSPWGLGTQTFGLRRRKRRRKLVSVTYLTCVAATTAAEKAPEPGNWIADN